MDALAKVFAEAGIQWMGWALTAVLVAVLVKFMFVVMKRDDRKDAEMIAALDRNTSAIDKNGAARQVESGALAAAVRELALLFNERMPRK